MKIIFLDIEGVLVNRESMKLPIVEWHYSADPKCVEQLNRVIVLCEAKLVISSTERLLGLERVTKMLDDWGVAGEIVGLTPVLENALHPNLITRGDEISAWLNRRTVEKLTHYIIIDDKNDMGRQAAHLIQTDNQFGLTDKDADRAIKALLL
jgi:hypothetical protein